MTKSLADLIEERIRAIPSRNPGYVEVVPRTLGHLLDGSLVRRIALEAADVAKEQMTTPDR